MHTQPQTHNQLQNQPHIQTYIQTQTSARRNPSDYAFLACAIAFALAVGGCVATGSVPF